MAGLLQKAGLGPSTCRPELKLAPERATTLPCLVPRALPPSAHPLLLSSRHSSGKREHKALKRLLRRETRRRGQGRGRGYKSGRCDASRGATFQPLPPATETRALVSPESGPGPEEEDRGPLRRPHCPRTQSAKAAWRRRATGPWPPRRCWVPT